MLYFTCDRSFNAILVWYMHAITCTPVELMISVLVCIRPLPAMVGGQCCGRTAVCAPGGDGALRALYFVDIELIPLLLNASSFSCSLFSFISWWLTMNMSRFV